MSSDTVTAAISFEAYFLRRMLSEVRGSGEGSHIGGGTGGHMFREMLDEALADAMAQGGGVGIADMLLDQIEPETVASSGDPRGYSDSDFPLKQSEQRPMQRLGGKKYAR